jgi:hypothetical protein
MGTAPPADPGPQQRRAAKVFVLLALAAWPIALALWLFPFDSDAAFVVHDALWYGTFAERTPAASINPSHPLFHVLVLALVELLRTLGV